MSILTLVYRATFKDDLGSDLTWELLPAKIVRQVPKSCKIKSVHSSLNSTVEGDVGIMCACMPFFPALAKNSPSIQRFQPMIRSLRSRMTRGKNTEDTLSTTQSSHLRYFQPRRAEESYMELGEAKALSEPPRLQGSNPFRTEFEGFKNDSW